MFELYLSYKEGKLDVVSIRCINCKRETGLFLKNKRFDEMITKFVLNAIFHHVGLTLQRKIGRASCSKRHTDMMQYCI